MVEPKRDGQPTEKDATALAVRELFERYRAPLLAYFLRRTRNAADAEDLTHDVFVRLQRLDPKTDLRNAEAFVFQTAVNLLRGRARRAMRVRQCDLFPPSPRLRRTGKGDDAPWYCRRADH